MSLRGYAFKLGHMEDIIAILESTPEVQSVGHLPYALHHPERYYKPSSASWCLPNEGCLKRVALFLPQDVPTICGAY